MIEGIAHQGRTAGSRGVVQDTAVALFLIYGSSAVIVRNAPHLTGDGTAQAQVPAQSQGAALDIRAVAVR